jgi:hypothetical protein
VRDRNPAAPGITNSLLDGESGEEAPEFGVRRPFPLGEFTLERFIRSVTESRRDIGRFANTGDQVSHSPPPFLQFHRLRLEGGELAGSGPDLRQDPLIVARRQGLIQEGVTGGGQGGDPRLAE